MSNLELVHQAYQNFAEGNVEAVLAAFHPDIEWNECKGFPFVEGDGLYIGPAAIVQEVFAKIPEYYEGFNIDIMDLIDAGNKVVMAGHYQGIWKETGKSFRANATHIWTIVDGKATNFFQAVDTATIIG